MAGSDGRKDGKEDVETGHIDHNDGQTEATCQERGTEPKTDQRFPCTGIREAVSARRSRRRDGLTFIADGNQAQAGLYSTPLA